MKRAQLTISVWTEGRKTLPDDLSALAEKMAPDVEHVAQQVAAGYQAGEICGDGFKGWWKLEADKP